MLDCMCVSPQPTDHSSFFPCRFQFFKVVVVLYLDSVTHVMTTLEEMDLEM